MGMAEGTVGKVDSYVHLRLQEFYEAKGKTWQNMQASKKRRGEDGVIEEREPPIATFPGAHSMAYMGGTIERTREVCAGNCNSVKVKGLTSKLPGLSRQAVDRDFPSASDAERQMLTQPSLEGRIWFGQALVYDEIYGLLQDPTSEPQIQTLAS